MTDPTVAQVSVEQCDRDDLVEIARRLYRGLEMQAAIMRDPARTGGWRGAENTARAFERQSEKARELHTRLAATQPPIPASDMADIIETIDNAADTWKTRGYTSALAEVRDMATIGRDVVECIAGATGEGGQLHGWSPMDTPAEIVTDLLDRLHDATTQPPAREEWQPIETAPKEAQRIDLWWPGIGFRPAASMYGHWDDDRYARRPKPYWTRVDVRSQGVADTRARQPTHWRPLPTPPTTGGNADAD